MNMFEGRPHAQDRRSEAMSDRQGTDKVPWKRDRCGIVRIELPEGITGIGPFADCGMLSSLSVLGSAETIGGWAFFGCTGLTVTVIPGTVRSIGKNAFENCPMAAVYNYSGLNIAPGTYGLPSSAAVRNGCPSVIEVRFFDGAEDHGTYAETVGRRYVLPDRPGEDPPFPEWLDYRDVNIAADTVVRTCPDGYRRNTPTASWDRSSVWTGSICVKVPVQRR